MKQPNMNMFQPFANYPQGTFPQYGITNQVPLPGSQATFPQPPVGTGIPQQTPVSIPTAPSVSATVPGMLPIEQSYIENILRLNKGKLVIVYATFENNREWNAKIFNGIIEAAGRDHLIISDPQTGERYLIPMVFIDYIAFEEEIDYLPEFGGLPQQLGTYPPR